MKVGDVFKLSTDELRLLVAPDAPKRKFILNVILLDWNVNEVPPGSTRRAVGRLLPLTLPGEPLNDLHPGTVTVWRGGILNPGKVESYSSNKKIARGFGKTSSLQLTPEIPALALDRLWGAGRSENEVIILTPRLVRYEELRLYVQFIVEAAVTGDAASKGGLALFRGQRSGLILYILYDPAALAEEAKRPEFFSMRFSRPIDQIILGFIKAMPHSGDCHDAMEVKMSAASKGYGPLMYDIVMSDGEGGLMPDRISTSGQAKKVWQFYGDKRGDVEKKPFDDEKAPKNDDTDDDCALVGDDVLDAAYDGAGQSGTKSQLMQRHEEVATQFEEHGLKKQALESVLMNMGDTLFDTKYGK